MVGIVSILSGMIIFIRANPRAILIWSLADLGLALLARVILGPLYSAQLEALRSGVPPDRSFAGLHALYWLAGTAIVTVLHAAVFRAVLFPSESRFGYLRLGRDELRLAGLMLLLTGLFAAIWLTGVIVSVLLTMMVTYAGGQGAGVVLGLCLIVAAMLGLTYLAVRISPAGPMTIEYRQILIGPAWRLSRGRFWPLFGSYCCVFLLVAAVGLALFLPTSGPFFGALAHPRDPAAQLGLAEWQASQSALSLSPNSLFRLLTGAILGGLITTLFAGVPAIATAQLLDEEEVASR